MDQRNKNRNDRLCKQKVCFPDHKLFVIREKYNVSPQFSCVRNISRVSFFQQINLAQMFIEIPFVPLITFITFLSLILRICFYSKICCINRMRVFVLRFVYFSRINQYIVAITNYYNRKSKISAMPIYFLIYKCRRTLFSPNKSTIIFPT